LRPAAGPPPTILLPRFERFRLDGGLRVVAVRHDDVPEISARLLLPYGAVEDERERVGTALLVARALTEGTKSRSAREVAEWIDFLGARFNVDVNHDSTVLSLHCLSRVFSGSLDFLAEIVSQPAFLPDEVARLRDERLDEIASGLDEPRVIANLRLHEAIFGTHPYGTRAGGTEETVRRLDSAVLAAFHARYYRPGGATLVLVGDLPEGSELRALLEKAFRGWLGDGPAPVGLEDPQPRDKPRLWAVEWDGPQSEIRVGDVGIARLDSAYATVAVMNAILGGLFSSRINMNLRESKGWTYGAGSRVEARKRRGAIYTATAVEARATVGAVKEILAEMERLKSDPPNDAELELAINALTLSLPRLFETAGQVSSHVLQQVLYGLPDDYWERYVESVRRVGQVDVVDAAQRLLATDRVAIVIVGPLAGFRAELETLGPVEVRDVQGRPAQP
jgi:predicted Zn-dependent peptidase